MSQHIIHSPEYENQIGYGGDNSTPSGLGELGARNGVVTEPYTSFNARLADQPGKVGYESDCDKQGDKCKIEDMRARAEPKS